MFPCFAFKSRCSCLTTISPTQVMKNDKTVDPRDKKSTKVIQLETAMGAAISCFEGCSNNSETVADAEDLHPNDI